MNFFYCNFDSTIIIIIIIIIIVIIIQIDVLRDIVLAVDNRLEVYLDGGVRTGTDVLKALALGARAVFIGRPAIYAVAYNVQICFKSGDIRNLHSYKFNT